MFVVACAAILWPGIGEGKVTGFRDGFHFYFPQAVWLDQCAERGDFFPQWQAYESLGVSVPGETTSAIYYPLRIVMLTPGVDVAQRMALFVAVHLAIAAGGMAYACSRLRLRTEAGWIAGAAFAFSSPVFFQLHNLIYLCSAAWLGFLLAEIACWLKDTNEAAAGPRLIVFAGGLAMIVLAGDPHTAVNVVLLSAFLALATCFVERRLRALARMFAWLGAAVVIAIGLSAVQSIPSLLWAAQSHRMLGESPEMALQTDAPELPIPDGLLQILSARATQPSSAIYEFSLSPWHVLTVVWPTLGGDYSAGHARVFAYLPSEGRMWIPSLFFGVVPLLLLFRRRIASGSRKTRWLMIAAVFALIASFGNYSVSWLLREAVSASGGKAWTAQFPADHTTSLYGVLADYLPGYSLFRYPAKWSVLAVACFSLAAAVRFDRFDGAELLRRTRMQRFVMWTSGCGLLVASALTLGLWMDGPLAEKLKAMTPVLLADAWLGPPMFASMCSQILLAFGAPLVIVALISATRVRANQLALRSPKISLRIHELLAWLCMLETFVVAMTWISFVKVEDVVPAGPFAPEFVWADPREPNIVRDGWLAMNEDREPLAAITDYQRQFALGKLGLLSQQHNLAAALTMEPNRIKRLRSGLSRLDNLSSKQAELDAVLAWLGVERRLVRERRRDARAEFGWQRVANSRPLCEFFVRSDDDASNLSTEPLSTVRWQWLRAGRLEISIDCQVDGSLLVRQFNDGGWRLKDMSANSATSMSSDATGLFAQFPVAAGQHKFTLERRRWPLQVGATISCLSLLVCFGVVGYQVRMASATRSRSK